MTLRTVPEPPHRAAALLYFEELAEAGAAVAPLVAAGAAALEIMDAASLRSQAGDRDYPFAIGERTAALLAEFRADSADALAAQVERGGRRCWPGSACSRRAGFTTDAAERDRHWHLRKGLFPSVGNIRPSGTAVVIEDVVVPVERLAEAITDLRSSTPNTASRTPSPSATRATATCTSCSRRTSPIPRPCGATTPSCASCVRIVVGKYDGALKAEHGSGRNMAPFVRDEWGDRAYEVMQRIKAPARSRRHPEPRRRSSTTTRRSTSRTSRRCPPSRRPRTSASSAGSASRAARRAS